MNFKKCKDFIKNSFILMKKHIKCLWYLLLLMSTTYYVSLIHNNIIFLWPITKITTIFILWIVLLIVPLFSEIEFGGFKLKKEIEKTRDDIRRDIVNLQSHISNNNNNNAIYFNSSVWSKEELNNVFESLKKDMKMDNGISKMSKSEENKREKLDGKSVDINNLDTLSYLAHVRVNIEKSLREICFSLNYEKKRNGSFINIVDMLKFLYDSKIINNNILSSITQIQIIASRSLHGEFINNEYLEFVKKTYPLISEELNKIKKNRGIK